MSNLMFALAAAMLATTASAQAADAKDQPVASATDTGGAQAATPKRYCIKDTPTGTRIEKKTCKTREEWLDTGFDPLKPNG
jgi:hypothetical protein